MRAVVNYFRLWWVNRDAERQAKQFEAEHGRAPNSEERVDLMQKRIDYFRRAGLR